jgi:hypothetical protein
MFAKDTQAAKTDVMGRWGMMNGAHRDDEQEIVTGRQSFMKLFFLLL